MTNNQPTHKPATPARMANAIRALAMDAVEKAHSGHPGMPMGMADIATVLFSQFLKFDPSCPEWPDRDRFLLSNGHGSMLLYAMNYLTGYEGMTLDQLKNFRQLHSHTAGHPEIDHSLGIETTTGPLGQGLANGVGMALAERLLNAEFGDYIVDHYTYVFAGDGCLSEGISHEAISLAGHLQLGKLIVFFDDNHITIDGATNLANSDNQVKRFEACHWDVQTVDGHDQVAIAEAIRKARTSPAPSMIACRTTIGFGAPHKGGTAATHGAPLGPEEIAAARKQLDWPYPPFEIPDDVLQTWRQVGRKNLSQRHAWEERLAQLPHQQRDEFTRRQEHKLPAKWTAAVEDLVKDFIKERPQKATRQLSQVVLNGLCQVVPELLGGSADLTDSNKTKASGMEAVTSTNYAGRYIHYGVREHGMAAVMNGINSHGGFIPYGGSFLTFTDYCRPSIRLAALMKQGVIFVMTHDSIGLGEDGPTHQPIEHLASLRAIPNLNVFRPADSVEVAECWALALESRNAPSVIALTRQSVPTVRTTAENLSKYGAYILQEASGKRQATILSTGSEISVAMEAQAQLEKQGISTAVVSMPCWRLFDQQSPEYKTSVLGKNGVRVAVEAASPFGWERYVGMDGGIVGISTFGASAPAEDLYKHFGITTEKVVETVLSRIANAQMNRVVL